LTDKAFGECFPDKKEIYEGYKAAQLSKVKESPHIAAIIETRLAK